MSRKKITAAAVAAMVVALGVAVYFTQSNPSLGTTGGGQTTTTPGESQTPTTEPTPEDFTTIEEQLSDLENFMSHENLDSDFGVGAVAGGWG